MGREGGRRQEDRREEILRAAFDVFAERGYHRASIATIAERVGLSQQGVLHYFPSKRLLLAEVLRLRDQRNFIELLGQGGALDLDTTANLVEYNTTQRGLVQSFTVLSAESVTEGHPARGFFEERYARSRQAFAEQIEEELGDRLPAGLTAEQAATLALAVMDGLQLQWLLDSTDGIDMPALFRAFLALLRSGGAESP
ncbi:TetR/AcrR family transcriptional regulator [Peterkaempfera sp. SMS 1(5)a]|uniref:TetR/AcrR family transcriptional regulator n=1 Tax=Peterkaempfera podocarpi TaxID=3232308 RepID=UPI00366E83C5